MHKIHFTSHDALLHTVVHEINRDLISFFCLSQNLREIIQKAKSYIFLSYSLSMALK